MPWCPRCGSEYREGFTICKDCAEALVDNPPQEQPSSQDRKDFDGEWSFLTNVYNSQVADMLVALLEAEEIPVIKKHKGAGQYVEICLGTANDVDLYVPESCLDEAVSLIEVQTYPPAGQASENESISHRREIGRTIIIVLVLAPFLIYLLGTLFEFITN